MRMGVGHRTGTPTAADADGVHRQRDREAWSVHPPNSEHDRQRRLAAQPADRQFRPSRAVGSEAKVTFPTTPKMGPRPNNTRDQEPTHSNEPARHRMPDLASTRRLPIRQLWRDRQVTVEPLRGVSMSLERTHARAERDLRPGATGSLALLRSSALPLTHRSTTPGGPMRQTSHRRRRTPRPRGLAPLPHGPFGPVTIRTATAAELVQGQRSARRVA
jgi:hypothetical protein